MPFGISLCVGWTYQFLDRRSIEELAAVWRVPAGASVYGVDDVEAGVTAGVVGADDALVVIVGSSALVGAGVDPLVDTGVLGKLAVGELTCVGALLASVVRITTAASFLSAGRGATD